MLLMLVLIAPAAVASDWPETLPREGECTVCSFRGGEHGVERYVDWREHDGGHYGFCSEPCAEAFDQMPSGYVPAGFPRLAPEFSWTALDGSEIRPAGQSALLIDFWATWCAPCIAAMPDLESLVREFAPDGLRVVGISIDEQREDLESFLERRPVSYPLVHDGGDDPAWWQFRVPAIPAAYLLNGEGEIVAQWNGKVEFADVRAQVERLLTPSP
jgi:thiol-disulfide isomerase/thioredoxin